LQRDARTIQDRRDILAEARRVRAPSLYVGAREDALTEGVRQPRQLHGAMGGELMLVRGPAHGIVLLDDPAVVRRITAFVRRESH
jgi:pimeloyl-ACP methyl ester carboxylesterase